MKTGSGLFWALAWVLTMYSPAVAAEGEEHDRVRCEIAVLARTLDEGGEQVIARDYADRFISFAYTVRQDRTPATVGHGRIFTLTADELAALQEKLAGSTRFARLCGADMVTKDGNMCNVQMGKTLAGEDLHDRWPGRLSLAVTPHITGDDTAALDLALAFGDDMRDLTGRCMNSRTVVDGQALAIDGIGNGEIELLILLTPHVRTGQEEHVSYNRFYPDDFLVNMVDLNRATLAQLQGIGFDELAARLVIAYRQRQGDYAAVTDLLKVPGVTVELYDKVKWRVTLVDDSMQR